MLLSIKDKKGNFMSKLGWLTQKVKKHKKLTIAGVIILILAIVATTVITNVSKRKDAMMAMMNQTQTSKVEKRTLVSSVSATGTLTSVKSKEILVDLSGVEVKSVSVQLGDMVEAGQIICEFDSTDVEENLAEAKTALNVASQKTQMDLTNAERNLADAKEDYDTDLKRANTDLGLVYNDYVLAVEDEAEALANLNAAKENVATYSASYQGKQNLLNQKTAELNAAGISDISSLLSSKQYEANFENSKSELEAYVDNASNKVTFSSMDMISLENNNLSMIIVGDSEGDFVTESANVQIIRDKINTLIQIQKDYNNAKLVEEYNALKSEVTALQKNYETAVSNQSSAEKTYEQAVSVSQSKLQSYDKQKRSVEDTEKSVENNLISKTDSLTTAQLNALSSGNSEEEKVEQYQQQLDDCTVEAPFSGVISAVNIEAGDTYNGSAIVTLDDISSFEVTAQIDEYDIGKIKKGQKVVIKTNATGDEELEGTVKIVSPKSNGSGSEVTYTVIISIDTPNEMLRMDMTAKLSIILESKENVLTVPYEAVQEDAKGNYYVEVVDTSAEGNEQNVMTEGMNPENMPEMPEGVDFENMPAMPEGMDFDNMPSFGEGGGDRPAMPSSKGDGNKPEGMSGRNNFPATSGKEVEEVSLNTRRIYVEKGIESDYYIEIFSNEITEGMEVVVPKTEAENGGNIQMMMMRQGPMGGF